MSKNLTYYIYAYIRMNGAPYYIGKGKGNRAWQKTHSVSLPKEVNRIIIMESNLTEIGALALERFYIRWYGRKNINTGILHNLTDGGEGISNISEITRQKMRNNRVGRPLTDTQKRKISASLKGKVSWNKGKNLSEIHKEKIKKSHPHGKPMLGKIHSEETREKMRLSHIGQANAMKGKKYTKEMEK